MSGESRDVNLLIIRRSGSAELDSPKGGVWKIAYADFMTAMMAFFLVMWLINATSETTKTGVANYFNPIKLSDGRQLPKKGLQDPELIEPMGAETAANETAAVEAAAPQAHASPEANPIAPTPAAVHADPVTEAQPDPDATQGRLARFSEDALFRDPYAVLAAIAAEADGTASLNGGEGAGSGPGPEADAIAAETYDDPFDPAAWKVNAAHMSATEASDAGSASEVAGIEPAASAAQAWTGSVSKLTGRMSGTDGGRVADEEASADEAALAGQAVDDSVSQLQARLAEVLGGETGSRQMPNVSITNADGGVLISLADQIDFGMFAIGSAEPLPETIAVMTRIAEALKRLPGKVIIRGHTDGRPFRSDAYDNWRLSAARAHMAYHMLVRGGLDEERVERIEGYADRDLKLPDDPEAAENRRIDILVQEVSS